MHLEGTAFGPLDTNLGSPRSPRWLDSLQGVMRPFTGNERAGSPRIGIAKTGDFLCRKSLDLNGNTSSRPLWNAKAHSPYRAVIRLWACAERLYEEGETEAAADVLYMTAKRTINAVANSRSSNPIKTRAKFRQLKRIVQNSRDSGRLLSLWDAAWRLHTYADQTPALEDLERDWCLALEFIARMLAILLCDTAPEMPDGSSDSQGTVLEKRPGIFLGLGSRNCSESLGFLAWKSSFPRKREPRNPSHGQT